MARDTVEVPYKYDINGETTNCCNSPVQEKQIFVKVIFEIYFCDELFLEVICRRTFYD